MRINRIAVVAIAVHIGDKRRDFKPGEPLPDDISAADIRQLERLGAFEEKLVDESMAAADVLAAGAAGGASAGTNTSAAEGDEADVSAQGAAKAAPEAAAVAEPTSSTGEGDTPHRGDDPAADETERQHAEAAGVKPVADAAPKKARKATQ